MKKSKKTTSRNIGVEIGAICSKYFLKSRHLHYGYWTNDLEIDMANLPAAQENYVNFLISHIPEKVRTILDVGCGFGEMAKKLIQMGYQVDCISPSPFLNKQARELLGDSSHIFECFYEELQTENRYDLILFSESFQYIHPEDAIKKSLSFLNSGGYVLICDFFKKDTPCKSPLSGGHPLNIFYNTVSEYPLESLKDIDITEEMAPTLDIFNDVFKKVIEPSVNLGQQLLNDRYPFVSKCMRLVYRKRLQKLDKKYFRGEKTGENFRKFKSYRLLLYKKTDMQEVWQSDFAYTPMETNESKIDEKIRVASLKNLLLSNKSLSYTVRKLIRWRALILWLVFVVLIGKDVLTGKNPHELLPSPSEGISTMAIVAIVLVTAGVSLRFWARGHSEKNRLSAAGPYMLVRHPLYLGSLLITLGVLCQLNDWLNWVIIIPLFAIFYGTAVVYEEKSLAKRFGEQWQLYKARVPVLIPSLRHFTPREKPHKWEWNIYLNTWEWITTLLLLSVPWLIEALENYAF